MKTKRSAFFPLILFALSQPLAAVAQQPGGPQQYDWAWPGPWHMWNGGWGFGWMFPLFMLFMVIVCVAVMLLMHRSGGGGFHPHRPWTDPTFSALQILNERYARGEIQKNEYDEKKAAIVSGGPR